MLQVMAEINGITTNLNALIPATNGGSLTDLSVPEKRIIHWIINRNSVDIFATDAEFSVEVAAVRVTSADPKDITILKKLLPGETFTLPIQTVFGKAVLTFIFE